MQAQDFFHEVEFDADFEIAHALAGLDEGPPDIVVPDDAGLEGDPRLL